MADRPTLTIEILETIVDQLAAADDIESLRCLSLTCNTLLPRTRHHLFGNLTIRTLEKLESSVEFLESHPSIRLFIQKVTLSVNLHYDYSHRTVPLLAIAPVHLLCQLPNLRTWHMGIDMFVVRNPVHLSLHRCTLSCYKRFAGHIQGLELISISFDHISDFVGLVSSFIGVQTLTCSRIWFRTTGQQESILTPKVSRTSLLSWPPKFTKLYVRMFHGVFIKCEADNCYAGSYTHPWTSVRLSTYWTQVHPCLMLLLSPLMILKSNIPTTSVRFFITLELDIILMIFS